MMLLLALTLLVCAAIPCVLFLRNLGAYTPPPPAGPTLDARVSVLIPARNEARNIEAVLASVLRSERTALEVVVYDDGSTDDTAERVRRVAASDARVRLLEGPPLPAGWNGKQHACWQLAHAAGMTYMLFLDADVRLEPAAIARMLTFAQASGAALVSGFPRLVTVEAMEWLLLPLIHFVLLGFLPMRWMRKSRRTSLAAGCGQFLLVETEAYFASGGHAQIRTTMHDGLMLPRVFRAAGFRTDLADLTELASVRMYESPRQVWNGLAKNAFEGLGAPSRIVPLTLLLLAGQVAPLFAAGVCAAVMISVSFVVGAQYDHPLQMALVYAAVFAALLCSYLPRLAATRRFRQPLRSALLHPAGIVLLLAIQWYALCRHVLRRPVGWRQRAYAAGSGAETS